MTPETARHLAIALNTRDKAAAGLVRLQRLSKNHIEVPDGFADTMRTLASTFVHEQRIINRIVHDDTDD